jgi:hypothetical protein
MTHLLSPTKLALAALVLISNLTHAAEPSPLAPLASLTTHEWDAQLPDRDGKKVSIHARLTWSAHKQAILINNQFVIDGKAKPYVDGLYAWNPEKKVIVFTYVGAEGDLTEGTVRQENDVLVHEFRQIHAANGKVEEYVARVTPHGDEGWDNAIFLKERDNLKQIVQVRYLPSR